MGGFFVKRIILAILSACLFSTCALAAGVDTDNYEDNRVTENPYLFFDTYDDRMVDWPLVDTGYGYASGVATNFDINVVNYKDDNNVLKLSTKPHKAKSSADNNLALIYCIMHVYDGKFVVENDFNVSDDKSSLRFFIRGTASTEIENLVTVKDGFLCAGNDGAKTGITVSDNEWHNIAVITDIDTMHYELMFDGQTVFEGKFSVLTKAMLSNDTSSFRIEMITEPEQESYLLLDNFKVYRGGEILDNEYLEQFRPEPFFIEYEPGLRMQKLQNAVIFALDTPMVKLFSKNREIDKNNLNIKPFVKNGKYMIPLRLISEAFGYEVGYDGNVYITSGQKQIRLDDKGNCSVNGTAYKSIELDRLYGSFFADAKAVCELLGKKAQITKNDLIIVSDTENFFDENAEKFSVTAIGNLLKSSKYGPCLISGVSDEELQKVRDRIAKDEEPYKTAWNLTLENANKALTKEYPMVLCGYSGGAGYNDNAFAAGNAIRDLAFVYRVTGNTKYAKRAKELLDQRVSAPNPFNVYRQFMDGEWANYNTLVPARSGVAMLYGYTFLYPYLDREFCDKVELWAGRLAEGAKYVQAEWIEHDCYDKQYWQNHMVLGEMLMISAAIVNQDIDWLYWVVADPENERKMPDLITGSIIMGADDELYASDPTLVSGAPEPERGEIYDRSRMRVGKGFHYANLTARGLAVSAEMLYNNGYDFFDYYGKNGERLEYVFEYYGAYFVEESVDIKSGYYSGSAMNTSCAIWPIGLKHYPYNTEIRRTCLDVRQLAQTDGEQLGYLSCLTHGVDVIEIKDSKAPDIKGIKINGNPLDNFRPDKHTYNISVLAHEAVGAKLEFDTDANIVPLTSDDRWAPQKYLVFDKEDMNKRAVYSFVLDVVADTQIPKNAKAVPCTVNGASESASGNEPELTIDNSYETLWTVQGTGNKHWIEYKLDEITDISFITLMFTKGTERNYFFSVDVSQDGKKWERVFNSKSSGKTDGAEKFSLGNVKTQYIRINCEGNTANDWNNICDFKAYTLD